MSEQPAKFQQAEPQNNARVVFMCLGMVFGMGGLAYASVPLYELFCQVTGYGGTTQRVEDVAGVQVIDRNMNVRFDANTAASLDWEFKPETRQVEVKLGEQMIINYVAKNNSDKPIVGMASFNVTPQAVGAYFNKIECFCFTDTYIEPGGTLQMPVSFFVDPDLDLEKEFKNIKTITLSYTFFQSDTDATELSSVQQSVLTGDTEEKKL